MTHRFFVETPITSQQASLIDAEAHHLMHVLRGQLGMEVVLFDNSGAEFLATVVELGRRSVGLEIVQRREVSREVGREIVLGIALPKGDRQRWVIEKLVELGAGRLVPLRTERSVAQPNEKTLPRLRRAVVEASKQCGRNRLMEISEPQDFSQFVVGSPRNAVRLLAHPGQKQVAVANVPSLVSGAPVVCLAIGPEGGFTDQEVQQASDSGWIAVALGPRILRIETAALALTTLAVVSE